MNDKKLQSPEEIKSFLEGTQTITFSLAQEEKYAWLAQTLKRTRYFQLEKKEKSIVRVYLTRITQYSRSQLNDLIKQYKTKKWIGCSSHNKTHFSKHYTREDILLLIETDKEHDSLSGLLTKKLFERAYKIYQNKNYERLANISSAHIYNLRKGDFYKRQRYHYEKTKRSSVAIGVRRKPKPNGIPGYIRIDTVHQGDLDKKKGVYHINAVDEVTQFEVICSVEKITEQYLIPILEVLLLTFPFKIKGFHSDNGSEYVNAPTAKLLNKLHIEFTKSRPRRSNDNGLVESKNGSIIRKVLGYVHIPQRYAPLINEFNQNYLVPYLNYHRPCYFSKEEVDEKGKIKKVYPYENIMTPYEKLKSLDNVEQYLNEDISFEKLDLKMMKYSDLESARRLRIARKELFHIIFSEDKKEKEVVDEPCIA